MAVNLTDGGVYRLRHVPTRNVLTLKTVDDNTKTEFGPLTVSKENNSKASLGAAQTWVVNIFPKTKTYTFRNAQYGVYAAPIYQSDANTQLKAAIRPFHWKIVPSGNDTESESGYSIFLPYTTRNLTVISGEWATTYPEGSTGVLARGWLFVPVASVAGKKPKPPKPVPALSCLPSLQDGTYRIRNTGLKNLLTQKQDLATGKPYRLVVANAVAQGDAYQEWNITVDPDSQNYFIQNKASGLYLGYANETDYSLSVDENKCQWWDIRQGEYEGSYILQVPGISWAAEVRGGTAVDSNVAVTVRRGDPTTNTFTFWIESTAYPTNAISARPVNYLAPLKTGKYIIRNSLTRATLTQAHNIVATADYNDPNILANPFEDDNLFQQWTVSYVKETQTYIAKNEGSGRYLSSMYSDSGADVQGEELPRAWSVKQADASEEFIVQPPGSRQTLTVYGGYTAPNTRIYLTTKSGPPTTGSQKWLFQPVDRIDGEDLKDPNAASPPPAANQQSGEQNVNSKPPATGQAERRLRGIRNVQGGLAIDYRDPDSPAGTAIIGGAPADGTGQYRGEGQEWIIKSPSKGDQPGRYALFNPISQKYLSYSKPPTNGSAVVISDEETLWDIKNADATSGTYIINVPGTGLVIDLNEGSNVDGTPLSLKWATDENKQKWRFEEAAPA